MRILITLVAPESLNIMHTHTGGAAAKPGTDKDFWNRALQTPIHDKQPAGGGGVQYPELYRGGTGTATMQTSQVSAVVPEFPSWQSNPHLPTF